MSDFDTPVATPVPSVRRTSDSQSPGAAGTRDACGHGNGHEPLDVPAVRAQFPILTKPLPNGRTLTYLDSGATAQKPAAVLDAMRDCFETYYSNVHRGKSTLGRLVTAKMEEAREDCRRFLNAADASEVVFTAGTTAGLNLVAQTWGRANVRAGDVIATTVLEHHCNLVPWQMLAEETGAELRFLPLTDDGRVDMGRIGEAITDRCKLLAVTACSNVLGTLPDVRALCDAARDVGAVSVVDAAQYVPHRRTDVRAWGCDFLAFGAHKLYGPTGVGVLYGRRELLDAMPPWQGGGNMIDRVFADRSAPGPNRPRSSRPAPRRSPRLSASAPPCGGWGRWAGTPSNATTPTSPRTRWSGSEKSPACTSSARRPTSGRPSPALRSTGPPRRT